MPEGTEMVAWECTAFENTGCWWFQSLSICKTLSFLLILIMCWLNAMSTRPKNRHFKGQSWYNRHRTQGSAGKIHTKKCLSHLQQWHMLPREQNRSWWKNNMHNTKKACMRLAANLSKETQRSLLEVMMFTSRLEYEIMLRTWRTEEEEGRLERLHS